MTITRSHALPGAICLLGCALHVYAVGFRSDGPFSLFLVGLFLWSCAPYALAALLPVKTVIATGFALGALAGDLFMHYTVFIAPKGSTAALGLLFMPLWNLLLLGPLGAAVAWGGLRILVSGGHHGR